MAKKPTKGVTWASEPILLAVTCFRVVDGSETLLRPFDHTRSTRWLTIPSRSSTAEQ